LEIENSNRQSNYRGGGIYNEGALTVKNSMISGNTTNGWFCGGIYNGGTLMVTDCSISSNSNDGIYSEGTLLIVRNSTISYNSGSGIVNSGNSIIIDCYIMENLWGGIINGDQGELTITNCLISRNSANLGGGIYSSGTLTVTNCTISGNTASSDYSPYGGGIYSSGTLTVTNCTISGNTASTASSDYSSYSSYGGGIYSSGTLTVTNSTISGNTASSSATSYSSFYPLYSYSYGGGIYNEGMLTMTNCTISDNTASSSAVASFYHNSSYSYSYGGGIYSSGTLTVTNSTISGNTVSSSATAAAYSSYYSSHSSSYGGGIYSSGTLTVTNSTISDNTASSSAYYYYSYSYSSSYGGGIYSSGTLTVTNSTISDNTASSSASSYYYYSYSSSYGGGIYNANAGSLTVTNSTISGNIASSYDYYHYSSYSYGGGIYSSGTLTVTNSTISGNTASSSDYYSYFSYSYGSGIYNEGGMTVTSSLISENSSFGIYNENTLTVTNSTIAGNSTGGIFNWSGTTTLYNTIIVKDSIENGNSGTITGFNNLTTFDRWNGNFGNNLLYDDDLPLFIDADNGDYRLAPGSQAINGGDNQFAYTVGLTENSRDMAGNPRFVGESIDIGAYEFQTPIPAIPLNFRPTDRTQNSVTLRWDTVTHATGYVVQYKKGVDTNWTTITGLTETGVTISTLVENTDYDFRVQAINSGGASAWATTSATTIITPTHKVFTTTGTYFVEPGSSFILDIKHELLNKEEERFGTGLGLRIEYDPTWLTYTGYQSYLTTDALNAPREDTKGIIIIAWNDQSSNWPGTEQTVDLLQALFLVKEDAPFGMSTPIYISVNYPTVGFRVEVPPVITINFAKHATLDISGTGSVTPADANLLLRYLYSYTGVGLTQYLVTSGAERDTAEEIIGYLEENRSIFDIDGDGNVTPVDANLLLRYLYSYTGEGLTQYLVTSNSTRKTATEIISYIESVLPANTGPSSVMAPSATSIAATGTMDLFTASASEMPTQRITASTNVTTAEPGTPLNLKVYHEILDRAEDRLAWGISLIVHYDPVYVEYQPAGSTNFPFPVGSLFHNSLQNTITIGWNDHSFNWPGTDSLVELLSLNFNVKAEAPTGKAVFEIEVNWPTPDYNLIPEDGVVFVEVAVSEKEPTPETPSTIVTTLSDVIDPNDGLISLREAILYAESGDIITFASKLYGKTITLGGSELFIDKSINIDGIGTGITIDAAKKSRVVSVASGTSVTLAGLAITNGNTTGDGGGINNAGRLTLIDCKITGNSARRGGGITSSGTTTIIGGTISGNTSTSYGGGVYIQRGTTTIENCTISGNAMVGVKLPSGAMSGGFGGGIYNGGTLYLTGGEITNNTALLFGGGGLYNEGRAELDDCIISDNEAEWGGGVSNSNSGTMTITGATIKENKANQGYGGIGNAGNLTLTNTIVTENIARKLGGGLGNNTGAVLLNGTTDIFDNASGDEYQDVWTNREIAETLFNTLVVPTGLSFVPVAPVYEISAPTEGELFAKTLTYWEFSAAAISSSAIKDWEVNWGDGSEPTLVLGGPRSRISVTHYFREAGTYSVTIKTTDFDGVVNTITIGTYTVKERVIEPLAVAASFGPELGIQEFSFEAPVEVYAAAPMQFTSESRFTEDYLSDLMEIMRQRQMLDLDQSGQKSDSVTFTDLIWSVARRSRMSWRITGTRQTIARHHHRRRSIVIRHRIVMIIASRSRRNSLTLSASCQRGSKDLLHRNSTNTVRRHTERVRQTFRRRKRAN